MPGKQDNDEHVDESGKVAILVPSKDPEKENDESNQGKRSKVDTSDKKKKKKKKSDEEEDELSEEDRELKDSLELAVARAAELGDEGVTLLALQTLRNHIKTATSSMTAVPKPLKFLSPLFNTIKATHEKALARGAAKIAVELADILSVLSMVQPDLPKGTSLQYKLTGTLTDLDTWGHEFIRSLAGEIGIEHQRRAEADPPEDTTELMTFVDQIVPFNISHSAEAEAVDLLMEVQELPKLLSSDVDSDSTNRICNYLLRAALYIEDPEYQAQVFGVAYKLYERQERWCDVLRVALRANNRDLVEQAFASVKDPLIRTQMAFVLAQHRYFYFQVDEDEDDAEDLNNIIGNEKLSEHYKHLATDLDVTDAKDPKDVYKSHLADTGLKKTDGAIVKTAQQSQAATYVNAFVNMGFCHDNLATTKVNKDGKLSNEWIFQNKAAGQLSGAASIGMIYLWAVDPGMGALDNYSNITEQPAVRAGSVLGMGLCNAGTYSVENDVAFGNIDEQLNVGITKFKNPADQKLIRTCCLTAFGLAFAATSHEDSVESLTDVISDEDESFDVVAAAALSAGLVCVGTGFDNQVFECILDRLMQASDEEKATQSAKYVALGLGLLFLGCGEAASVCEAAVQTIEHPVGKYALFTLRTCAYCGLGDQLKVQELLHECCEHLEGEAADFQMVAVLGIAMITLGEDVGMQMAHRTMQHMLQYGELPIKRTVPLALAMLHLSDPDYSVVDTLSRLSHDPDKAVAGNAILAMGLAGCGTNNSRIAGLLKQLSVFYKTDGNSLYMVRIAQGLLHMGKGLVTINPYHSDRLLLNRTAVASVLIVMHGAFNLEKTLLGDLHYHLYYLATAAKPRMLITVDEELEPVANTVRVGEAVDTVGQAGHPRTITGFQTHNTPVLLHHHERAVFATDDYEPIASILEGTVICRKLSAATRAERKLKAKREAREAAKAAKAARDRLAKQAIARAKKSGGGGKK